MKHKILKLIIKLSRNINNMLNNVIKHIQEKSCNHLYHEKVNYSWAPGHIVNDVEMCSICGKIISDPFNIKNMEITSVKSTAIKEFTIIEGKEKTNLKKPTNKLRQIIKSARKKPKNK